MTETWLSETIQKVYIESNENFRADRLNIKQGGTTIYVHRKLEGKLMMEISLEKCELVVVNKLALNTINLVTY